MLQQGLSYIQYTRRPKLTRTLLYESGVDPVPHGGAQMGMLGMGSEEVTGLIKCYGGFPPCIVSLYIWRMRLLSCYEDPRTLLQHSYQSHDILNDCSCVFFYFSTYTDDFSKMWTLVQSSSGQILDKENPDGWDVIDFQEVTFGRLLEI